MRRILSLVILILAAHAEAQSLPGWTLLWADEFSQTDGSPPDSAKWGYDIGGSGWGNNELQYYTNRVENARIEAGNLVIEARAENYGGRNHTSARLLTKGKSLWTYGRMEARIKIPRGQGIWPAFWMLGANIDSAGWPNCGEIDIMENIGAEPSVVHGTIHGPGYSGGGGITGGYTLAGAALADGYHVYAIERVENRISWFIDGQQYLTLTPANLPSGSSWVFNQPQFLILNVAVGGNWPGSPDGTTLFPQRMSVDYVRVYTPALVTPPPGSNGLVNPGFEIAGPSGWTTFGGNVSVQTAAQHSGTRSLKVFGSFSGVANDSGASQTFVSSPGKSYSADAWLLTPAGDKIAGSNTAWVEVSFLDASSNVLSLYRTPLVNSSSTAGSWQILVVNQQLNPVSGAVIGTMAELVAPAGTTSVRVRAMFRQPNNQGGSVWYDDMSLSENIIVEPPADTVVSVDPAETWIGYMNVSNFPSAGGAFQFGQSWLPSDLSAGFSGACLTLKPNSIGDPAPYWYVGGGATGNPGNKIMGASMYVEKTDVLSGKTMTFTGNVLSNTFTGAHSAVAFIKDYSADYTSSNTVTAPLVNGVFSISLATVAGTGRHVQYGFEVSGVNVWFTDLGPFGSVRITAPVADPFLTWIGGFDFSGFTNPDLSATGDPDGDGCSNLEEFALNGDPRNGNPSGKIRFRVEPVAGDEALVLTLPVLDGAGFGGAPAKTATVGNLTYAIEGSNQLVAFDQGVTEINPASVSGLPALNAGWSYRSFRLDGVIGGTGSRGPAGYLRVRIVKTP